MQPLKWGHSTMSGDPSLGSKCSETPDVPKTLRWVQVSHYLPLFATTLSQAHSALELFPSSFQEVTHGWIYPWMQIWNNFNLKKYFKTNKQANIKTTLKFACSIEPLLT